LQKPGSLLTWNVRADRPERFAVDLKYSTPQATYPKGGKFVVKKGDTVLTAPIEATPGARQLKTVSLGELEVKPGELQDITVTVEGSNEPVHFFELDLKQP
jgi:hypothetical protein